MRRGGLFVKYLIPLVLLSAGGLLANSLIELYFSYQENKLALGRIQQEKAANAAIRIEQFVREIEHQLLWIAQTPWESSGASLDHRRLDSLRLLRHVPAVTEVTHLDPSGREQLRVSRLAMDVLASNTDFSKDPKFTGAVGQQTYFSPVYFRKESEPYITLSLGGRSEGAGVVVAEANLKFIWDVVSRMEVGSGGYAYVLDNRGHLIAHPDISLVLQQTDFSALPQVQAARAVSSEESHSDAVAGRDLKKGEVLAAYASISPLGWNVFVERPVKEAFAPLYASALRTGGLLLAGILISIGASLMLVRRMVKPIQTLQAGATQLGSGSLTHRIEINTGDELEALGGSFNRMAEQLEESYAGLERKVEERTRDLQEALEQQTATSDVLRVISQSQRDVQPVFDAIGASALKLSGAQSGAVYTFDGELIHLASPHGLSEEAIAATRQNYPMPPGRGGATARAILTKAVAYVPDVQEDAEFRVHAMVRAADHRCIVSVPMLRNGEPIGAITMGGPAPGMFSERQIAMLQTFADQAVIAIENVRLFTELQEQLEQQTATSEILRVISSSVADTQPVFDKILASCEKLFESSQQGMLLVGGDGQLHLAAHHGTAREGLEGMFPVPYDGGPSNVSIRARQVLHYPDILGDPDVPTNLRAIAHGLKLGNYSQVLAPMMWEDRGIGILYVIRQPPAPFSEKEIGLLKTFADQAAIAIENARLFHEIEHKSRELEIASQHKSEFLANMSHELRTPLNAIIGFSEVLKENMFGDLNDKQFEYVADIHSSGQHLLSLINDILDLSKVEAGRMELNLSKFDVPDAIDSAMLLVRERASRHGLELTANIDQRLNSFSGDERKFKQILLNLLSNSVKFTPEGGNISIIAVPTTDGIEVAVKDTGIGIAPEDQAMVFEAFRQAGNNQMMKREGTGLGLALVKQFVEMHGGQIWLESAPNVGSTFTFTLTAQPWPTN